MTLHPSVRLSLVCACVLLASLILSACGSTENVDSSTPTAQAISATPSVRQEPSSTATETLPPSPTVTATLVPTETATPTSPPEEPTATEDVAASEPETGTEPDLGGFQAELNDLLGGVDGVVAVSLLSGDGTVLYEHNGGELMEAASLYKLPIMVELYRQRDAGLLSFDDAIQLTETYFNEGEDSFSRGDLGAWVSVESLLFAMIAQSSNVASYGLLDYVGSANVNATMANLGLNGIEIRWSPVYRPPVDEPQESYDDPEEFEDEDPEPAPDEWVDEETPLDDPDEGDPETEDFSDETPEDESDSDSDSGAGEPMAEWLAVGRQPLIGTLRGEAAFNVVTASDVAHLLQLIVSGEFGDITGQEMLDLLGRQQIYGGLPELLPEGTVAHKTGYLEDGVINDAGVIFAPSGPLVAVVLTESVPEYDAYSVTSQIGLLLYQLGS